jgi:DsbC/DsbD-like thiol-disulfide interchange protein/cytochrome c biogenesis protein CcdA
MTRRLAHWLLLLWLALPAAALAAAQRHMDVSLMPEARAAPAGGTVTLAIVMRPQPGWHGYWENPGDAGMANRIAWSLPAGASAGSVRYPVPQRLLVAGLMNYVYEGEYAALVDLKPPPGLAPGAAVPVAAKIDYLVCTEKICVPESADVATALTVGAAGRARDPAFDRYRAALPRPLGTPARFEESGGRFRLGVPLPANVGLDEAYFFPRTDGAIAYGAPQSVSRRGDWLIVETNAGSGKPGTVDGILAIGGALGLEVKAAPGKVPAAGTPLAGTPAPARGWAAAAVALLGAIAGGLLLNVMPCVFPILSLKALSLARAGGEEGAARREALAYTAGVVSVCLALGGTLLAVRAGGAAVGWAFQLQDPRVTLLLFLLVGAIALNLAGLFELPGFGGGEALARRGGLAGAFWTGALAAFVATPCTGPFMGAALGAALVLPAAAALAVFAGLGLGLALPFLALGFAPALRRRLPRPGPWMSRLRRILAVPMALTALWLGWLLGRQAGSFAVAIGLGLILLLGVALWWAGRRGGWLALVPALAAAAAGLALLPGAQRPAGAESGIVGAEPFSEARLASLRAAGRPVFVYFTADWCLTCKVNEKAVLEQREVAGAFRARHIAVLVGDWTRGDPAIGRFLEKEGRSGVPLYLWYAPGKPAEVLPQILTVGRVAQLGS